MVSQKNGCGDYVGYSLSCGEGGVLVCVDVHFVQADVARFLVACNRLGDCVEGFLHASWCRICPVVVAVRVRVQQGWGGREVARTGVRAEVCQCTT